MAEPRKVHIGWRSLRLPVPGGGAQAPLDRWRLPPVSTRKMQIEWPTKAPVSSECFAPREPFDFRHRPRDAAHAVHEKLHEPSRRLRLRGGTSSWSAAASSASLLVTSLFSI